MKNLDIDRVSSCFSLIFPQLPCYNTPMKRIFYIISFLALTTFAFAEKITFTTGDIAGTSLTDRFMPMDFSKLASQCTVSAIKKVEKDIWCIKITASKTGGASSIPIEYEYFVKKGDKIRIRRFSEKGMSECILTVESVDWNCASFEAN